MWLWALKATSMLMGYDRRPLNGYAVLCANPHWQGTQNAAQAMALTCLVLRAHSRVHPHGP